MACRLSFLVLISFYLAAGCSRVEPPKRRASAEKRTTRDEATADPVQVSPSAGKIAAPNDWFEDVTERSSVDFTYRNGRDANLDWVVETIGGGVAMIDYDQDGDLDLFFPGGGQISGKPPAIVGCPCALYRNDGDWNFTDVTTTSGLDVVNGFSFGAAVGDMDHDGYPDIFLTCYRGSRLYRNTQDGRFEDVTEASNVSTTGVNTAAVFADFDKDGWDDLFVAGYFDVNDRDDKTCGNRLEGIQDVCGPWDFPAAPDRLYRNLHDGRFEDVTEKAGIRSDGKALGVLAGDINEDGQLDFFVTNDTTHNHLYLGSDQLPFNENALTAGVAASEEGNPEGSMGVDLGDYDGDGRCDLWFSNYEAEDNALCRGTTAGTFERVTLKANLGSGRPYVGFGAGLADLDSDGWLDLFVTNGHVLYRTGVKPYEQKPLLYRNTGDATFRDVANSGGPYFRESHPGRGVAIGDLDNDGALDIVVVHQNAPVTLLRNRNPPSHWIGVDVRSRESASGAIGARVSTVVEGRTVVRHVRAGAGYLSHSDQRVLFPVHDKSPKRVTVAWTSGHIEVFNNVQVGRMSSLVEGTSSE